MIPPKLLVICHVLMASTSMVNAQHDSAVSLLPDTGETEAKLGTRFAVGALYTSVPTSVNATDERFPVYGAKTQMLVPVGAQLDFTAGAEFNYVPERSYTEAQYVVTSTGHGVAVLTSAAPASQLAGLSFGLCLYARTRNDGALAAMLNPRLKRLFWRHRGDRSGFHIGCGVGLVHGWHRRVIRTLPAVWPANEPIPESAMLRREEPYTRWYQSVTPLEAGWTFNGHLDITIGTRLMGLNSFTARQAIGSGLGDPRGVLVTGALAWMFGHNGSNRCPNSSVAPRAAEGLKDSTKLGSRVAIGGAFAITEQDWRSEVPNISYGPRADALVPIGAHLDIMCAGDYQITPPWSLEGYGRFKGTNQQGQYNYSRSARAGLRLGLRYYARTRPSPAYATAGNKRSERAVWRQRVERSGFHFDIHVGLIQSWHRLTLGGEAETWSQRHWITPSPGLGWTFNGVVDAAVSGGYVITSARSTLDNAEAEPWLNICLALVLGRKDCL